MIEKIAEKIIKTQIKFPKVFLFIFLVLTLAIAPGIFNLVNNVEPSLEKVLPSSIEEIQTMENMRTQFGADMMYLVVYPESPIYDVRNPELLKYIDTLAKRIVTNDYVYEANTMADLIQQQNNNIIPDSIQETKQFLKTNPMTLQFTNRDYSLSLIRVRSDTGASAQTIKEVVNNINADIEALEYINPGSRIEITGFNAIDKATFEVIMSDFGFITIISMIFVMIVVFLTFRKFIKSMLPMLVVIVSLIWTMGIVGYLNFTITVVTMVAAAMIMGLGIDFGIHIIHTFYENKKTMKRKQAITETMKELLRATTGASLTTISGFLALLFGVLPAMKTLGLVLAIGIFTTLIGAVFLLPVVVYLYDGGNKNETFE